MDEKELAEQLYKKYLAERKREQGIVSKEYLEFISKKKKRLTWWEDLAIKFGSKIKVNPPRDYVKQTKYYLDELNSPVKPEQVFSLAILSVIVLMFLSIPLFCVSRMLGLIGIIFALYSFVYVKDLPKRQLHTRKIRASSELVLAVLYIVIYMRTTSNLEGAVRFAAENLTGPLAEDLKKILWDVESKKYVSLQQALDFYVAKWKGFNDAFVDAIYLIETSMLQRSEERRLALLEGALKRILDGTYSNMVKYTNALRTPVRAIFMLGITLPIMSLVMLPLITVFLSELITPQTLFVFYDILLPVVVMFLVNNVLANRPEAFPPVDLSNHPTLPKPFHFRLFGKEIHAAIPAVILATPLITISMIYAATTNLMEPKEMDVVFGMLFILGLSVIPTVFSYLSTKGRIKVIKEVKELEREFSYVSFQLANRLGEGLPAEIAMMKTAEIMKGAKIAKFVEIIRWNLTRVGLPLRDAIFDSRYGAIRMFPSSLVRAVMSVLVESIKKSNKAASTALSSVSQYLLRVNEIEDKIEDVLSDTVSTLKFQTTFIAPIITGIVIGLTSMIMIVLYSLSEQVNYLFQSSVSGSYGIPMGTFGLGFFSMSKSLPLFHFSVVVGFYMLEFTLISIYLESRIENGEDNIMFMNSIAKMFTMAMVILFIISVVITYAFGGLGRMAVGLGEFL